MSTLAKIKTVPQVLPMILPEDHAEMRENYFTLRGNRASPGWEPPTRRYPVPFVERPTATPVRSLTTVEWETPTAEVLSEKEVLDGRQHDAFLRVTSYQTEPLSQPLLYRQDDALAFASTAKKQIRLPVEWRWSPLRFDWSTLEGHPTVQTLARKKRKHVLHLWHRQETVVEFLHPWKPYRDTMRERKHAMLNVYGITGDAALPSVPDIYCANHDAEHDAKGRIIRLLREEDATPLRHPPFRYETLTQCMYCGGFWETLGDRSAFKNFENKIACADCCGRLYWDVPKWNKVGELLCDSGWRPEPVSSALYGNPKLRTDDYKVESQEFEAPEVVFDTDDFEFRQEREESALNSGRRFYGEATPESLQYDDAMHTDPKSAETIRRTLQFALCVGGPMFAESMLTEILRTTQFGILLSNQTLQREREWHVDFEKYPGMPILLFGTRVVEFVPHSTKVVTSYALRNKYFRTWKHPFAFMPCEKLKTHKILKEDLPEFGILEFSSEQTFQTRVKPRTRKIVYLVGELPTADAHHIDWLGLKTRSRQIRLASAITCACCGNVLKKQGYQPSHHTLGHGRYCHGCLEQMFLGGMLERDALLSEKPQELISLVPIDRRLASLNPNGLDPVSAVLGGVIGRADARTYQNLLVQRLRVLLWNKGYSERSIADLEGVEVRTVKISLKRARELSP